jgi:hypothetical protein
LRFLELGGCGRFWLGHRRGEAQRLAESRQLLALALLQAGRGGLGLCGLVRGPVQVFEQMQEVHGRLAPVALGAGMGCPRPEQRLFVVAASLPDAGDTPRRSRGSRLDPLPAPPGSLCAIQITLGQAELSLQAPGEERLGVLGL